MRIGGGLVILEWLVVCAIVRHNCPTDVGMARATHGFPIDDRGRRETALEPAPGDVFRIEQIARVRTGHGCGGRARAIIKGWIDIVQHGAIGDHRKAWKTEVCRRRAMCLASNQVQRARRRRAKGGAKGIVAHGKVLSIVPEGRDGIAIVIIHHNGFICAVTP